MAVVSDLEDIRHVVLEAEFRTAVNALLLHEASAKENMVKLAGL